MTVSTATRTVVLAAVRAGYVTFINTTKPVVSMAEFVTDAVLDALIDTGWTPPPDES